MIELLVALIISFAICWGVLAYLKAGYANLQTGPETDATENEKPGL